MTVSDSNLREEVLRKFSSDRLVRELRCRGLALVAGNESTTLYMVRGDAGAFYEHHEWDVKAFRTPEAAYSYIVELNGSTDYINEQLKQYLAANPKPQWPGSFTEEYEKAMVMFHDGIGEIFNTHFDPHVRELDIENPNYEIEEIELVE